MALWKPGLGRPHRLAARDRAAARDLRAHVLRVGREAARVGVDVADVEVGALVADPAGSLQRAERGADHRQRPQRGVALDLAVQLAAVAGEPRRPAGPAVEVVELVRLLERLGRLAQPAPGHVQELIERPAVVAGLADDEVEAHAVRGGEVDGLEVALVPVVPGGRGVAVEPVAQVPDAEVVQPRDHARPVAVGGVVVDDVGDHANRVAERGRAPRLDDVGARDGSNRQRAGPYREQSPENCTHVYGHRTGGSGAWAPSCSSGRTYGSSAGRTYDPARCLASPSSTTTCSSSAARSAPSPR